MTLWWLSFATDEGFLGAAIVETLLDGLGSEQEELAAALRLAHRLGINPGGEVMGVGNIDPETVRGLPRNKLMQRQEFEWKVGPRATPEELEEYLEGQGRE